MIKFKKTQEYLLEENEYFIIDPEHILTELNHELPINIESGILLIDNVEMFIFKVFDNILNVIVENINIGEVENNSGYLCILKFDDLDDLNGDYNLGLKFEISYRELLKYNDELIGVIKLSNEELDEYLEFE